MNRNRILLVFIVFFALTSAVHAQTLTQVGRGGTGANMQATGPGPVGQASSGANFTIVPIDLSSSSWVTGDLGVSHLNSGTSASSSTWWNGAGSWASLPTATTSSSGISQLETSSTDTTSTHVVTANDSRLTGGGSGINPTDYVSGCLPVYDSSTVVQVSTGNVYVPAVSALVSVSSTITYTPSLSASTIYYLYLENSTTVVSRTSAPATNYLGTAWEDSSGYRYIGSFLTDSSSHIYNFLVMAGNGVTYRANTTAAPFLLLSAGTATSSTSVSCAGVVPATCRYVNVMVLLATGSAPTGVGFGSSDGVTPSGTTTASAFIPLSWSMGQTSTYIGLVLNSGQEFLYSNGSGSNHCTISLMSYVDNR